jgi:hypothetical protein
VEINYNSSLTIVSENDSMSSFGIGSMRGSLSLRISNPSIPVALTTVNGQDIVLEAQSVQFGPLGKSLLQVSSINQLSVDGKISSQWLFLAPGIGAAISENNASLVLITRFDLLGLGEAYVFLGSISPQDLAQSISYQTQSGLINSGNVGYAYLALVAFCSAILVLVLRIRKKIPNIT